MATKIMTTAEISAATGLNARSVRRRLGSTFPTVTIQQGNRVLLGTTEQAVREYNRTQKNANR